MIKVESGLVCPATSVHGLEIPPFHWVLNGLPSVCIGVPLVSVCPKFSHKALVNWIKSLVKTSF